MIKVNLVDNNPPSPSSRFLKYKTPEEKKIFLRGISSSLDQLFLSSNLKEERPESEAKPTEVEVKIAIRLLEEFFNLKCKISFKRSIGPTLDGDEDDIKLDIYLRQFWSDKRLRLEFSDFHLPALHFNWRIFDNIWSPDTMFIGSRESYLHTVSTPNRYRPP